MTRTTNPASVLARLKNLQRDRYPNMPPNTMLQLYAQQGFLARLDASPYADRLVLKGAMSLFARYGQAARPTQDLDLATRRLPNTPNSVKTLLEDLCAVPFGDGLTFDPASIRVRASNEGLEYPGVKAFVRAALGPSRVELQFDFSFGNVVFPAPVRMTFPRLLLDDAVRITVYPLETVITEKFAALVEIGDTTTRMKDLYDLWIILGSEPFSAETVGTALLGSFTARKTPLDRVADVLGDDFAADKALQDRWTRYLRQQQFSAASFPEIMELLRAFYGPLLLEGRREGNWDWEHGEWR